MMCTDDAPHPVFGAPLHESLKYASVQISTANSSGELYVWGDIPVVVAKWCAPMPFIPMGDAANRFLLSW